MGAEPEAAAHDHAVRDGRGEIRRYDTDGQRVHIERRDGKTVLRLVNSGIPNAPEWDGFYNGTESGWRSFLRTLRHYLEHHGGRPRTTIKVIGKLSGSPEDAWARLVAAVKPTGTIVFEHAPTSLEMTIPELGDAYLGTRCRAPERTTTSIRCCRSTERRRPRSKRSARNGSRGSSRCWASRRPARADRAGLLSLSAGSPPEPSAAGASLRTDTKVSSIPSSDRSEVARLVSCAREGGQHDTSHCYRTTHRADDRQDRDSPVSLRGCQKRNSIELRRRITATRFPEKETVADFSQGVQLAFMQALARYWATDYDWRQVRGATELASPIHHRDRRVGYPLHSRPLET